MDFNSTIRGLLPLIDAGMSVHWLHPRQKRPINSGWSEAGTQSASDLEESYEDEANIGVRLGKWSKIDGKYLHLIDLDVRDSSQIDDAKAALRRFWPNFDTFPHVISGSGGESRHFYFLTDKAFHSRKLAHSEGFTKVFDPKKGRDVKKWDWEIELFGTGKQAVLPPSIHPDTGEPYRWGREIDLDDLDMGIGPEVPVSLVETWVPRHIDDEDVEAKPPLGLSRPECQEILAKLPIDEFCEDRDGWLQVGMALHHEFQGTDEGFDLWCEFSKQSEKFDIRDQKVVWDSFKPKSNSVRMATLKKFVATAELKAMFDDAEDDDEIEVDDIDDICGPSDSGKVEKKSKQDLDWMSYLERGGEKATILSTMPNLVLILANDNRTKSMIRYNDFVREVAQYEAPGRHVMKREGPKGCIQLEGPLWEVKDKVNGTRWVDAHDNGIRWMIETPLRQGGWGLKVTDRDLRAAVDLVARKNVYHPVKDYLNRVKWDGTPRMESFFVRHLGANDDIYHRKAAELMLLAAVVRIFEPSHKFDFVVILEGVQGKGKSSFIEALAVDPAWYSELNGDFEDTKSMVEKMQGKWILELPELQGFTKSEVNDIKAFISTKADNTRLAYARRAETFQRQSVFMGSTNDREYLRDQTGGRRFWPVFCSVEEIDIEAVIAEIDQVWAEAVVRYHEMRKRKPQGVLPLYMSDESAKVIAKELQDTRRVETLEEQWAREIREWLDKPIPGDFDDEESKVRKTTCLLQLWVEALGRKAEHYTSREPQLVGRAMRLVEGWEPVARITVDGYGRGRGYVKKDT